PEAVLSRFCPTGARPSIHRGLATIAGRDVIPAGLAAEGGRRRQRGALGVLASDHRKDQLRGDHTAEADPVNRLALFNRGEVPDRAVTTRRLDVESDLRTG